MHQTVEKSIPMIFFVRFTFIYPTKSVLLFPIFQNILCQSKNSLVQNKYKITNNIIVFLFGTALIPSGPRVVENRIVNVIHNL